MKKKYIVLIVSMIVVFTACVITIFNSSDNEWLFEIGGMIKKQLKESIFSVIILVVLFIAYKFCKNKEDAKETKSEVNEDEKQR